MLPENRLSARNVTLRLKTALPRATKRPSEGAGTNKQRRRNTLTASPEKQHGGHWINNEKN